MNDDAQRLADRFESERPRLRSIAVRILGSSADADHAVQETWIRLSRADTGAIGNLSGWLTTVVSRIALDMLRSRRSQRIDETADTDLTAWASVDIGPEDEAVLGDAVGRALLVVLDSLSPSERLSFVLHDVFGVPFDEVGAILGRSPAAAKQLASRARRRVRGTDPDAAAHEVANRATVGTDREREVVTAFLAAARNGEFEHLLALLHPDVYLHADAAGVAMGSPEVTRGAHAVASTFSGRALGAAPALIDGSIGFAWAPGGSPKVAWEVTFAEGQIVRIDMVGDTATLSEIDLEFLAAP